MIPKEERITVYKRMLKELNTDSDVRNSGILRAGLCYLLITVTYSFSCPTIVDYPELMRHKPEHNFEETNYWFDAHTKEGTDKRREILEDAINNPIED